MVRELIDAVTNPYKPTAFLHCDHALLADAEFSRLCRGDDAEIVFGNTPNLFISSHVKSKAFLCLFDYARYYTKFYTPNSSGESPKVKELFYF